MVVLNVQQAPTSFFFFENYSALDKNRSKSKILNRYMGGGASPERVTLLVLILVLHSTLGCW